MAEMINTRVTLRIFGKEVKSEDISKKLECLPTYSALTGQEITSKSGKKRIVKEGYWRLEYSGTDDIILEEKIKSILNLVTKNMNIWKEITSKYRVDIFCGLFMNTWNEGFIISADMNAELASRGLIISYDIYSSESTEMENNGGINDKEELFDYQIENDPEYLRRIERARKDIRNEKGVPINKLK